MSVSPLPAAGSPADKRIHLPQKEVQGEFPDLFVQGTQTEFTAERTAPGGLHIHQLPAEVLAGVEAVGGIQGGKNIWGKTGGFLI
jgi:hypothetical protein